MEFTPSNGDELQSEYLVPAAHGPAALEAVRALAPRLRPLLQVSEIRTVAADRLWLSTAEGRDSVGVPLHLAAASQEAVEGVLAELERALAPFAPRPHWGKVFLRRGRRARAALRAARRLRRAGAAARPARRLPQPVVRAAGLGSR